MILLYIIIFISGLLVASTMLLMGVSLFEYLKVQRNPEFDPENINLNYKTVQYRADENILLLHGLAGSMNYWDRGISAAGNTHNLYMPDLLGFGDSPKTKSEYTIDEHLIGIEKLMVKEKLNNGRTLVIGHSMGALLALALVSRHPDWYGGITLISLPVFSNREDMKNQYKESGSLFEKISVSSFGKFFCMIHPLYYIEWFRPDNIPSDIFQESKKHTWLSYERSLENIVLNEEITSQAKKALKNKKINFIHGDRDITAPYERAQAFATHFSNSKFMIIEKGGHQIYLTHYEAIWQNIKATLT